MTTTYTVPHWQKRLTSKMKVPCPDVIKMYYKGMGGVDVIDQGPPAFHLDQKSTHRFYLRVFSTWWMQPVLTTILFTTWSI